MTATAEPALSNDAWAADNEAPTEMVRHWPTICRVVARAQSSSLHCSIGSVGEDGLPNVTPIGMVFLGTPGNGIFFDRYTTDLGRHIDANGRICVQAVDAGRKFWLSALLRARFASPPGVRLDGVAGPLRDATPGELAQVAGRIRSTRWMKGTQMLWTSFTQVRDLRFTAFRPVVYPVMMDDLWR